MGWDDEDFLLARGETYLHDETYVYRSYGHEPQLCGMVLI
jgi:hypothetical protein